MSLEQQRQKVRVTKEFSFEAAHALDGYEGKCKDIHGHSYQLQVTMLGHPIQDKDRPDCGMVIDFSEIKKIVKDKIIPLFDHRLILREDSRFKGLQDSNERIRWVSYQPTCENMLLDIVSIISNSIEGDLKLCRVFLRETNTCYSEWRAEDN